jgi:hypothetical protein
VAGMKKEYVVEKSAALVNIENMYGQRVKEEQLRI